MKRQILFTLSLLLVAGALAAAPTANVIPIPVNGTIGGVAVFEGNFNLSNFAVDSTGKLVATGLLTGTLTDVAGLPIGSIVKTITIPVADLDVIGGGGSCDILHLELGPVDLDLLGLVVHLDRIVLDIDAETGSGNLLGNLLCAVTRLLDGGGPLDGVANLLNRILGVVSGLLG